jgi:hypothetical protein
MQQAATAENKIRKAHGAQFDSHLNAIPNRKLLCQATYRVWYVGL